ncbi:MAG TPA: NAD(+) synthase [Candidatus Polarisedimenticolia bacterium]|nr:NAD(+) synthase [Candidatus Polarisedimenticolia bacterium]
MNDTSDKSNFFNLYRHNFVRIAVGVPEVKVADPAFNSRQTVALMRQAADRHALIAVFPELGLSAYSCDDLFQQQALLDASRDALCAVLDASRDIPVIAVVGLPLSVDGLLFNCAAVVHEGQLLGLVPKTYLPNYREFYELRQFTPAENRLRDGIDFAGHRDVPFGNRLLFQVENQPLLTFSVEICEDLWVPVPPSSHAALAGATVLINQSASNVTVGKEDYRRLLVADQSGRCIAAYVYCAAGSGESTTDLAWDGHGMIYENATRVAETQRFLYGPQLVTGDIDLERLAQDRMRQNSFGQSVRNQREEVAKYRRVRFRARVPTDLHLPLDRLYERFPYVPSAVARRDERCHEVYEIQVQGLVKRLQATAIDKVVIGVSGGLDSTQALIVCARAMDVLGHPRNHILAYTMPGFATTERTLRQARRLMSALGCQPHEIDIRPSCMQMLKDIGHPFAAGQPVYDVTFENVQAGERTSHLFRIANQFRGIVVGTSDLSELALGYCTYGVGDHMAHYHVNASVPKTLIQYLIRWVASTRQLGTEASAVLEEVLATGISPELVPGESGAQPAQRAEDVVGPYALQDFHLYYTLRFGYAPTKVAFLAWSAWHDRNEGTWPDILEGKRPQYTIGEIKHWLGVFLERFIKFSQFKRSSLPNAPKVGSGGSLSPRGDYRAPSDAEATAWLAQVEQIPDVGPQ